MIKLRPAVLQFVRNTFQGETFMADKNHKISEDIRQNLEQAHVIACFDTIIAEQRLAIATAQATITSLEELRKLVLSDKANAKRVVQAAASMQHIRMPG